MISGAKASREVLLLGAQADLQERIETLANERGASITTAAIERMPLREIGHADFVLVSIDDDVEAGLAAVRRLHEVEPRLPIVVLSEARSPQLILEARSGSFQSMAAGLPAAVTISDTPLARSWLKRWNRASSHALSPAMESTLSRQTSSRESRSASISGEISSNISSGI